LARLVDRPLLAITIGDPAGIGPEVIAAAWSERKIFDWCRPFVVGHPAILQRAVTLIDSPAVVREITAPKDASSSSKSIDCLPTGSNEVLEVRPGTIDARAGQAAYVAIVEAIELALAGAVDGIVTAPIHKAALRRAGYAYPGHTELLAERCGVRDFAMMLYLGHDDHVRGPTGLGVAHVTLHTALRDVFSQLTTDAIAAKTVLLNAMMERLKGASPRIGVAALNPHAGEEALFGDEEERIIRPAVQKAQAMGIEVSGPFATDTLMVRARDGEFDGVVAMYHDQGHIALKLLGMHRAVNVTLGLPIVRTSVAHGTAFDIAWQGKAQASSMAEAIRVAALLASRRHLGAANPRACK
jgi:4-phospho-D-threonate 3-dehydrogenase / 4-phospho-D-erythronate 3-dehydrogenase